MRYVNVLAAAAAVVVGFTGSLTAAHALSLPGPAPIPGLLEIIPAAEPAAETVLTVTYKADEKAAPVVVQLTCDPTGGDHPRAAEACAALAKAEQNATNPFAKPEPDQICTYIYGGPQTARVVGSWNGTGVDASFSRANGCEISRWDAIEPVLSPTAPAAAAAAAAAKKK